MTDRAGNSASVTSEPFTLVLSAPKISVSLTPAANSSGWRNGPVTAHFTCVENDAPLAGCPADRTISTEGAGQTVTGSVTDALGQTVSVTSDPFSIDLHGPTITASVNALASITG